MQSREQHPRNQVQHFHPPCPKCNGLMSLALIEPALEDDHDVRTFECEPCGRTEVVKMKFK